MTFKKIGKIVDGTSEIIIEEDLSDPGCIIVTTIGEGVSNIRSTSLIRLSQELQNGTLRHPKEVYQLVVSSA